MKLIVLASLLTSLANATPTPPTPPGPPSGPPPARCTDQPGTPLVAIDQVVDAAPLSQHAKITVLTNGAWTYELADHPGAALARASGCLEPTRLADLRVELATGRPWMADLSALAAAIEEPGAIARSPGKPTR